MSDWAEKKLEHLLNMSGEDFVMVMFGTFVVVVISCATLLAIIGTGILINHIFSGML